MFARLGDVCRQGGREIGDQQKGRQFPDGTAGILHGRHIHAGRCGGKRQVTQGDHGDLAQGGETAQGERAQGEGQQIEIQQRA